MNNQKNLLLELGFHFFFPFIKKHTMNKVKRSFHSQPKFKELEKTKNAIIYGHSLHCLYMSALECTAGQVPRRHYSLGKNIFFLLNITA